MLQSGRWPGLQLASACGTGARSLSRCRHGARPAPALERPWGNGSMSEWALLGMSTPRRAGAQTFALAAGAATGSASAARAAQPEVWRGRRIGDGGCDSALDWLLGMVFCSTFSSLAPHQGLGGCRHRMQTWRQHRSNGAWTSRAICHDAAQVMLHTAAGGTTALLAEPAPPIILGSPAACLTEPVILQC